MAIPPEENNISSKPTKHTPWANTAQQVAITQHRRW